MGKTLIDKHGSFRKICEHFASRLPSVDKDSFVEWMMKQETFSPSNYKKGMFGDLYLYHHAYEVWKKVNSNDNQHHMVLFSGKIGKGKSTLQLQFLSMVDTEIDMSRICYIPPHLFKRLSVCNPTEANCIDEGGNFFKARNSTTSLGKHLSQAFQLVRDLKQVFGICYDEPEKLDKDILDKIDTAFVKVPDSSEKGNRRYRRYYAFNRSAFQKILPLLKKKIPIIDSRCLKYATHVGHNSAEIPIVNDINETNYRKEKRKYLKDHMTVLANIYEKEYEEFNKVPEVKEDVSHLLTVKDLCSKFQKTSVTVHRWIDKYNIGKKVAGRWYFEEDDINVISKL